MFDEAGNLKPVATLQCDCAAAIKSIKFDRKTDHVSEVVLADKVAVAGLPLRSIGAVKGEDTANSIDRLGERLNRAVSRVSPRINTRLQMLSRLSPELAMELRRRSGGVERRTRLYRPTSPMTWCPGKQGAPCLI